MGARRKARELALQMLFQFDMSGNQPDQIIATHYQNDDPSTGIVTRTMPLCPYPAVAKFTGGDVNVAANWVCQRPANHHSSPGAEE